MSVCATATRRRRMARLVSMTKETRRLMRKQGRLVVNLVGFKVSKTAKKSGAK